MNMTVASPERVANHPLWTELLWQVNSAEVQQIIFVERKNIFLPSKYFVFFLSLFVQSIISLILLCSERPKLYGSERPKLHTILAFLIAIGSREFLVIHLKVIKVKSIFIVFTEKNV